MSGDSRTGAVARPLVRGGLLCLGSLLFCAPLRAQSQQVVDRLYALYNSSSTPATYKPLLGQALWAVDPQARRSIAFGAPAVVPASAGPLSAAPTMAGPRAAADATFRFLDLYSFPNPARMPQRPTIRVQVGLADGVALRIYDASGRLLQTADLSAPSILDDGNGKGPQYTYDYVWDTSGIASGVYICVVTAVKSGSADIKQSRRLAVVK